MDRYNLSLRGINMLHIMLGAFRLTLFACLAIGLTACQKYAPPAGPASVDNQALVPAGYDQAWGGLIDYVAQSSFSIQNFEKDSGLMVLGFAPGSRAQYIDCGTWTYQGLLGQTVPYAARNDTGLNLGGSKMNIRVRELSPGQTSIQVTALYQLKDKFGNYWEFTSNTPSTITVTSGNQRTCRSKNVAESKVIRDVQALTFR